MRSSPTPPRPIPDRLLADQRPAAELQCVSIRTLWTLAHAGEIPRLKIGNNPQVPFPGNLYGSVGQRRGKKVAINPKQELATNAT
jgi:hypothetical protein